MNILEHLLSIGDSEEDTVLLYLEFLERSRSEEGEWHHILPKCLFPEFRSRKKHSWNQVRLLKEDHIRAHFLLMKVFPNSIALRLAWNLMRGGKGFGGWNRGIPCSEETKNKISKANKGYKMTPESKEKISKALTGKKRSESSLNKARGLKRSEDSRKRMSVSQTGKKLSEETKKKISDKRRGQPGSRKPDGSKWVTNPETGEHRQTRDWKTLLDLGWILGMGGSNLKRTRS